MKKTLVFASAFFLLTNVKAQQTQIGIKGGLNISELHYSNHTNLNSKTGINAGFLAHINASKNWALQPELIYSLEGAKGKTANINYTYNLNYLNVPVLLQYLFDNGFRIEGGPQMGFLLSARTKINNTITENKNFNSTAVSIPLGLGYLSMSGVGFDARYVFGLSNINDNQNGPAIQSNVFQFGLFYQTPKHKMSHRR